MSTATLVLDFGQQAGQECPLLYVEVPESQVRAGEELAIRLWGSLERLEGWTLCVFGKSLGTGTLGQLEADEREWQEQVDFAASTASEQLEYPFVRVVGAETLTPIAWIDPERPQPPRVLANRGVQAGGRLRRKGYSCLEVIDAPAPLYGSLLVTVERVAHFREWTVTVPPDGGGDWWFFLYNGSGQEPYRRFAIALPDLAATQVAYRNYLIRLLDFSSEEPLAGATVWVDGLEAGVTDANGELLLEGIATGTHSIRAFLEGYLDTSEDGLSNETFVVS